jgi:hypothetical protein
MQNGKTYTAKMFIDATYEGDLMAKAKVDYTVGREAMSTYGEKWNGIQTGVLHHRHHFGVLPKPISPYVVPGDPSSGVLPRISTEPPGEYGKADKKVQAYNFRMCLSDDPANQVAIPKPANYGPWRYELWLRWADAFKKANNRLPKMNEIVIVSRLEKDSKTDINNRGAFSTDYIGKNWDYPEASYQRRVEIWQDHIHYMQGFFYFLAHDSQVPADTQRAFNDYALAKDEFTDTNHWPHQLYIREGRRMVGSFVMTQKDIQEELTKPERQRGGKLPLPD